MTLLKGGQIMGGFLFLLLFLIVCSILWALPLYLGVNFVIWACGISAHFTLLQAFAVSILINILHDMFFKKD
jgi:hypothetical protein